MSVCCVCHETLPEQTRGRPRQRCEPCAAVAVAVDALRRAIEHAASSAPNDWAALDARKHIASEVGSALACGYNGALARARTARQKARQSIAGPDRP